MAPKPGPCGWMSATQDGKNWFVLLKGKRYGPYTFAGLVHAAERGIVNPEAGVWCLGWDKWRIARNVPGLFEQEPEPEPDGQEEDVDSSEKDADDGEESERDEGDAAIKPDEAPSIGLSAGPPMSVSAPPLEPEPTGHGGGVRLAIVSVLAVLLILLGAGWAAISLGIIRVTFMF
jgi:GYF domain 2